MPGVRSVLKASVWVFYVVFVLEILFMISPAALYFYGVYGPVLNLFHRWAAEPSRGSSASGSVACSCSRIGLRPPSPHVRLPITQPKSNTRMPLTP